MKLLTSLPNETWRSWLICWLHGGHVRAKNFFESTGGEYCFWCYRRWPARPHAWEPAAPHPFFVCKHCRMRSDSPPEYLRECQGAE